MCVFVCLFVCSYAHVVLHSPVGRSVGRSVVCMIVHMVAPQLVFKGSELAGWTKSTDRVEHVGFGVVTGVDKKKFKTRDGSTVRLVDLLDEARNQMLANLEVRVRYARSLATHAPFSMRRLASS